MSEFFFRNIDDPDAIYTPIQDSKTPGTLDESIVRKYSRNYKFYHLTLQNLFDEGVVTRKNLREYYTFSVVRDPIDRQKSFYYFFKKFKTPHLPASVEEYKKWAPRGYFFEDGNESTQRSYLEVDGRIFGEFWLYENIEKHIENFMKKIGVSITYEMPRFKNMFRKKRDEEIQFDEQALNAMTEIFQCDFDLYSKLKRRQHDTN